MKTTMTVEQAKKALGFSLDRELSEWFGAQAGSVYNWRKAGTLPAGRIATLKLHLMTLNKRTIRIRA